MNRREFAATTAAIAATGSLPAVARNSGRKKAVAKNQLIQVCSAMDGNYGWILEHEPHVKEMCVRMFHRNNNPSKRTSEVGIRDVRGEASFWYYDEAWGQTYAGGRMLCFRKRSDLQTPDYPTYGVTFTYEGKAVANLHLYTREEYDRRTKVLTA
jgi:hypothetical protein